jgi:hypothetical protein
MTVTFGFVKKGRTNFSHPHFRRDSTVHELIFAIEQKRIKQLTTGASLHEENCPVRRLLTVGSTRHDDDGTTETAAVAIAIASGSNISNNNHHRDPPINPVPLSVVFDPTSSGRDSSMDAMIAEIIFELFQQPPPPPLETFGGQQISSTTSSSSPTSSNTNSTDSTIETNV